MRFRWVLVTSLLMSACSAAVDVDSSADQVGLPLLDETTTSVPVEDTTSTSVSASTSTSVSANEAEAEVAEPAAPDVPTTTETDPVETSAPSVTAPAAPSSTASTATTIAPIDPNVEFCRAAIEIEELGTFTALDDTEAAAVFFNSQTERWDTAAIAAPAPIAADVRTVATFNADMRSLLAANDFNLFAAFEELTELEASSGSDVARIRVDQFIYANCAVTPPLPEQATAAFYSSLLDSAEDRTYLAELLASAEVFSLDGAECFVGLATPDVMHPLVGAPSTPGQDAELSSILGTCRLSIGTAT